MKDDQIGQGNVARFSPAAKVLIFRQMLWGASFYGVYVLLTRFFLEELHYSEADTLMMLGAFGAVGPVFSVIGGMAADRMIGAFRAVYIGYFVYALGFLLLGVGAGMRNVSLSIFSIALIGYARGLSATCPTVLLGNSFAEDKRDDFQHALTLNYSINNLGSFTARYLFPFFIVYHGYQGNFLISTALMVINLTLLFWFRKPLKAAGNALDQAPLSMKAWINFALGSVVTLGLVFWVFSNLDQGKYLMYSMGVLALAYFIFEIYRASPVWRWKMGSVVVFMFILIVFYFYYGQMSTSMNIYAINLMSGDLFGFISLQPESNSAFNPMWCFLLGGPVTMVYLWLEKRGYNFSIPAKFAGAFVFSAIAFALLGFSTGQMGADGKIAAEWIIFAHMFQAVAELIVGSLASGFIFEMVPRCMSAFAIGLRAVTLSLSGIFAAVISTSIALPRNVELTQELVETVYSGFFYNLALLAIAMALITVVLSKVIGWMVARGEMLAQEEQMAEGVLASV